MLFFDAYPHLYAGGQRATMLMLRGLTSRGWAVELAVPGPGPFPTIARAEGLAVTELPFPDALRVYGRRTAGRKALSAGAALPGVWRRLGPWLSQRADIVHTADHRGQLLLGPAARLGGVPVVWHIHALNRSPVLSLGGAALARHVIVPSDLVRRSMVGLGLRPCTVVPYALAASAFSVSRQPSVTPTILTVSRLHPDKGLDLLLEAVAHLRIEHPSLECLIAGPRQAGFESYADELESKARRFGIHDRVHFLGAVPNAQSLLSTASVYVQASRERTELQPIAVLEAMAAGTPVVATDVGTVSEMLGGGARGALCPPDDVEALATAIDETLRQPSGATARTCAAQRHVREAASPERLVDQVEGVYDSL